MEEVEAEEGDGQEAKEKKEEAQTSPNCSDVGVLKWWLCGDRIECWKEILSEKKKRDETEKKRVNEWRGWIKEEEDYLIRFCLEISL